MLAIAARGKTGKALGLLGEVGRFRTGGYPQILLGCVERPGGAGDLLGGLDELLASPERCQGIVDRVLPVEDSLPFARDDVTETLCERFEPLAPRLCGRSFYVRAHLRGLKGRLEHPAVERALGDFLYEFAMKAGAQPTVRFRDPDVIVLVEVVGRRVGYAFLDREHRRGPLVHVK